MRKMLRKIKDEAESLRERIIEWRHKFHQTAELSFLEIGTTREVCRILTELGLKEMKVGVANVQTGVIADITGPVPGRTIALRADMDALPISEENDVWYKSQNNGVMHACGHDGHIAMLLGAAEILLRRKDEMKGRVRLIFQPSEEAEKSGAAAMINEGALIGVDAIAAIHLWQPAKSGVFWYVPGTTMASTDKFEITVRGKGGHAAYPHQTMDPVATAASIVCQLQFIVSRELDPLEAGVITVGKIEAGSASNIIPDTAKISGTMRALTPEMRVHLREGITRVAEHTAAAHRCSVSLDFLNGYPPTVNDEAFTKRAVAIAEQIVGPSNVCCARASMGAEDMGFYLEKIPGCFLFLGIYNEEAGVTYPHHNSRFNVDDSVLDKGAAYLASLALDFLKGSAD
jgi:amidohydrolase